VIYLDSCILIYAVENLAEPGRRARELLDRSGVPFVISPLVIHECLVGPIRDGDGLTRSRFESLFAEFEYVDIGLEAYLRAAELRARTVGLRTPDALHLAAAELASCDELWTNDRRLAAASAGLAVDVIGAS
jgi:predicted nucleic acid-binding protein